MILDARSCHGFLNDELARRLKANTRYSLRAFSRALGLSPGELSEILRGRRSLSIKAALKVARGLGLNAAETKHFLSLAQEEQARRLGAEDLVPSPEDVRKQVEVNHALNLDLFRIVSEWYCFAILNLAETEGFQWNESWIARRLGISVPEVRGALERLERVGCLERRQGRLSVVADYVISPGGVPSEAIRNYHKQILSKAIESLETQSVKDRTIEGLGLAVNERDMAAIRREIGEFLDGLIAKYGKPQAPGRRRARKTDVAHLSVALFRLTADRSSDKSGERS